MIRTYAPITLVDKLSASTDFAGYDEEECLNQHQINA